MIFNKRNVITLSKQNKLTELYLQINLVNETYSMTFYYLLALELVIILIIILLHQNKQKTATNDQIKLNLVVTADKLT